MKSRSSCGRMAALNLGLVLLIGAPGARAAAQEIGATHITAVTVARDGDTTIVSVESNGPLPEPSAGSVGGPPRIFFDFPGVLPKTRGTVAAVNPSVRRVRVAVHSDVPRVTRVVIDLVEEHPFQVDRGGLAAGRLTVRIGETDAPRGSPSAAVAVQIPPAPALPPQERPLAPQVFPVPARPGAPGGSVADPAGMPGGAAPPAPERVPPPPPPLEKPAARQPHPEPTTGGTSPRRTTSGSAAVPQRDGERYRQQVGGALDRARSLRSVLSAIDQLAPQQADVLERAATELDSIGRTLAAVRPPETLRATHDMVVRACTLGAMAVGLRLEAARTGEETTLRNAASAAAGSLLLLDRACIDLGCTPVPQSP